MKLKNSFLLLCSLIAFAEAKPSGLKADYGKTDFISSVECNASKEVTFTIASAWFSESVDEDADGYYSHQKLNFDVDASSGTHSVYAKISLCKKPILAGPCWYYTTPDFTVTGTGTGDTYSVHLGLPNEELTHGSYQVCFQVYDATTDDVLTSFNYPSQDMGFEPVSEDEVEFTIVSGWFIESVDNDADGYYSHQLLCFDVDATAGTHSVYAMISCCKHPILAGPCWYYTTTDFTITGTGTGDAYWAHIGFPNEELTHGSYQVCFQIYDAITDEILTSFYYITQEMGFEPADEDEVEFTIASAWWTESVDNDGDDYYSHRTLNIDVDATAGTHSIIVEVSGCKHPILAGPCIYHTTPSFTITGTGSGDACLVDIGLPNDELTYGTYQIAMQAQDPATEDPLTIYYDMGDFEFETEAEDAGVYVNTENEESYTIYPNPVQSFIHIDSNEPIEKIELYSQDGNKLKELYRNDKNISFDLGMLQPGIYFLRIFGNSSTDVSKIIKAK